MIPLETDLNGGFDRFVDAIQSDSDRLPWTLKYEERRFRSKEERVMRQVALEKSWERKPVEMLWKQLRAFALPSRDFKITDKDFLDFLTISGVSPLVRQRFVFLLKERCGGSLDALFFCKAIDLSLEDAEVSLKIIHHCFHSLPLPCDQDDVLPVTCVTRSINALSRTKKRKRFGRRGKMSSKEFATYTRKQQLQAILTLLQDNSIDVLTFSFFHQTFLTDGGVLASVFVKQIIEACAKYFLEPFGKFPVVAQRWINTTVPLPFSEVPADVDALLLQDVEHNGVDPNDRKVKRRKRKR